MRLQARGTSTSCDNSLGSQQGKGKQVDTFPVVVRQRTLQTRSRGRWRNDQGKRYFRICYVIPEWRVLREDDFSNEETIACSPIFNESTLLLQRTRMSYTAFLGAGRRLNEILKIRTQLQYASLNQGKPSLAKPHRTSTQHNHDQCS